MPVWAALLGIALAKKVVVFTAAKVYGIPKLYRKSQQLARWSITDKTTLKIVSGRIGYVYRVPSSFIARWFGPTAAQLARTLPSGPLPLQKGRSPTTHTVLKSSLATLSHLRRPFNFVLGHSFTEWCCMWSAALEGWNSQQVAKSLQIVGANTTAGNQRSLLLQGAGVSIVSEKFEGEA
ncbi:hypothetical protein WJX77_005385 [Trebouxia sp. C0004]